VPRPIDWQTSHDYRPPKWGLAPFTGPQVRAESSCVLFPLPRCELHSPQVMLHGTKIPSQLSFHLYPTHRDTRQRRARKDSRCYPLFPTNPTSWHRFLHLLPGCRPSRLDKLEISTCRCGGMADALDSESSVRMDVRVRIPPSTLTGCSAAWLARRSGGPEVAGSNPVIPTVFECSQRRRQHGQAKAHRGCSSTNSIIISSTSKSKPPHQWLDRKNRKGGVRTL